MEQRIPPHSDAAEKSVLGSVMLDKAVLFDVLDILVPEDFYSPIHKEIFEAVKNLNRHGEPVDTITVSEELKKRKSLDMAGGRAYIAYLSSEVPSTANVLSYARIVAEKSLLRRLIQASSEVLAKGYGENVNAAEILDFAEQSIFYISRTNQKKDYQQLKEILLENIKLIDEMEKQVGNLTGVTTGFIELDNMTSGLQKSDLIIVAARPSMGKTAFALNVAQNAAIKGKANVLVFSLEMSKLQLGQRMLSSEARIDAQKLKTGRLEADDWTDINLALDSLSRADIMIDDTPGISIMEIRNKCRRLKAEKGLDLVMIDYLQLMNLEGRSEGRQQEISTLSRMLKQMARELECPVIVLSQLSRAVEQRTDHRPQLSDLRESGAIEQDADMVMFLYRDEYYYPETTEKPNSCDVMIAKHRNGPTGVVELTWLGKYTKFANKSRERA